MKAKNQETCTRCGHCCVFISLGRDDPLNPELEFVKNNPDIVVTLNGNYTLGPMVNPQRCFYLEGERGVLVSCKLYDKDRPKMCYEFPRNISDINCCNAYRRKVGLSELTIDDFE